MTHGAAHEILSWPDLRAQIVQTLKSQHHTLPLSALNQLVILRNFATLLIKGYKRIPASEHIAAQWRDGTGRHFARRIRALARHYQIFGRLPRETRGGRRKASSDHPLRGASLLENETVEAVTRAWLTAQKVGTVTPRGLARALDEKLLPSLGICPLRPLSVRTARRWLIRLGWRRTVVRKGIYKDGHEREDVVLYRTNVFLPTMAKYEARMTKFEGPALERKEPVLQEGERHIVPYYHVESCLHANDAASTAW
jgi:hypothetical protein